MGFRLAYGTFAKSSRFMRLQKGKKSVFARISRRMASKALHFVNENIPQKNVVINRWNVLAGAVVDTDGPME